MGDEELKCGLMLAIPLSEIEALNSTDEVYELVGQYTDAAQSALIEAIMQRRPELDALTDFSNLEA